MASISTKGTDFFRSLLSEDRVKAYLDRLRNHHADTYRHSARVGLLCIGLGCENVLDDAEIRLLGYGGLLHDVGKLKIPRRILEKGAKLDALELEAMRRHPRLGFLELADPDYAQVRKIVVAHHEYKRGPYPRGWVNRRNSQRGPDRRAAGDRVPLLAQIVAVCDIYDALESKRAYKPAMEPSQIERVLRDQFTGDSGLVDQVLRLPE